MKSDVEGKPGDGVRIGPVMGLVARIGADTFELFRLLWRKRYPLALIVLTFGLVGLWRGLTASTYYEATSVLAVKTDLPKNASYSIGRVAEKSVRMEHFLKLLTTREVLEDVVREQGLRPELLPGMDFDPTHPPSVEAAAEYMARRLVRVRLIRTLDGPIGVTLWTRAADSTLARDVARAVVRAAEFSLQEKVRAEARATERLLSDQLVRTSNPELRELLRARIAVENDKALTAGPVVSEIWQQPTIPQHRVEPKRKMLLGLSLLLGAILGTWFFVFRDPKTRGLYFGLRAPLGRSENEASAPDGAARTATLGETGRGIWPPFAVLLLFMIFYNVAFKVLPSFATPRMAVTILFLVALRHKLIWVFEDIHENLGTYLVVFSVFLYSTGLMLLGGDKDATSIIAEFIYAPLLASHLYLRLIGYSWNRFHACVMWVVLIQSGIHIYSFFSEDYRIWLASIVKQTGNWDLAYASSPPGFSSGAAASFSVVQSLGVISSLIRLRAGPKLGVAVLCILTIVLAVISVIMSGRTGLLIAMLFVAAFTLTGGSRIRIPVIIVVTILLALFFLYFDQIRLLVSLISPDLDWRLNSIVRRAKEPFMLLLKSNSIQQFSDMPVPALRIETVLGTGFFRSIFDGRHDSAYVQMYYALGLPIVILYYTCMLGFFVRRILRYHALETMVNWVLPLVVLIAFMIETKEHLITKAFGIYAFALARLIYRAPSAEAVVRADGESA